MIKGELRYNSSYLRIPPFYILLLYLIITTMNLKHIILTLSIAIITFSCQKENDYLNNSVPVANAGTSHTITLPTNTVTVNGAGADADGNIVAYLWSQVNGPKESIIVNPGSPSTLIKDLIEGDYIFQLMVTDNAGATGVDTVKVKVNKPLVTSLTLAPKNNPGDIKVINSDGTDETNPVSPDIVLAAWTKNAGGYYARALLKFDLSSIPASATIISAKLNLFSYPPPVLNGNLVDANHGSNNSFVVQQASSNWSYPGLTWFNQPTGNASTQLVVPSTTLSSLDVSLDVKALVSNMVSNNTNHGFLLKLVNESIYTSRIFVSSHSAINPTKVPQLVIEYQ